MKPSDVFASITAPTLVLNEQITRRNIRRMAAKARLAGVRFRPHFKTHQSAQIGEWFREEGVHAITVSSVEMARYFAAHGWTDITLAFSVNLRQLQELNELAGSIRLGILVESIESVNALAAGMSNPADLWIKVDVGNHRTGLAWDAPDAILAVARAIQPVPHLRLCGLLTHSGHTYGITEPQEIHRIFRQGVERLQSVRDQLASSGMDGLALSTGDTPGCTLGEDFSGVDEIRPGNFVFFDAMQAARGVCSWADVAVVAACPVVALHPERGIAVLYGGAVHLSKDFFEWNGERCYGMIGLPTFEGWSEPLEGASLVGMSQEHGMVRLQPADLARLHVGDLVCVYPAHSCLTVSALGSYLTLDGGKITTFNK